VTETLSSNELDKLLSWIGRHSVSVDTVTPDLVHRFRATLSLDSDGSNAPTGIHWCLSPEVANSDQLGPDGHAPRGTFMPPVKLPRRMWAGSRLAFSDHLRTGDKVRRESRIKDISLKQGRTGQLCFVTVEHEYSTQRGSAIREQQDIVYREQDGGRNLAPPDQRSGAVATVSHRFNANPVVLFRYSALTFNGHRIHYDQEYATNVEGYDGLVVHGPLQATTILLAAKQMAGSKDIRTFSYRGVRPLVTGVFFANGFLRDGGAALWTSSGEAGVHMTAEATW
jgi:3-methylfumaryl-CoA hydratase